MSDQIKRAARALQAELTADESLDPPSYMTCRNWALEYLPLHIGGAAATFEDRFAILFERVKPLVRRRRS